MGQHSEPRFTFTGPDCPPAGVFKALAKLLIEMRERRRQRDQERREHEEALASQAVYDDATCCAADAA